MENIAHDVKIEQVKGHWEVYLDGEFYCSADSYTEAVNEAADIFNIKEI